MLVELVEVKKRGHYSGESPYVLETVFINPEHIVSVRADEVVSRLFQEGKLPWKDLNEVTSFSIVTLNGGGMSSTLTVVGQPISIQRKCFDSKRTLLKG